MITMYHAAKVYKKVRETRAVAMHFVAAGLLSICLSSFAYFQHQTHLLWF